ncbi:hypothetical protein [Kutzneria sp. NPDC052558]|uniref:hypothetical protein n=1 Tax=Kutzneria sp. NPDC052558 TaxID=3364121 RepID=UPI0037C94178
MTPLLGRRALLRLGALAVLAAPAVAACTSEPAAPPPPDPLSALADAAAADAVTARALAAQHPQLAAKFQLVATNRDAQAVALRKEIDRATPPPSTSSSAAPSTPKAATYPTQAAAVAGLAASLTAAQSKATEVALAAPAYRAGLVGSVVAGCACLKELLSP